MSNEKYIGLDVHQATISVEKLLPVALALVIETHTLARSIDWPSSLNTLPVMGLGAVGSIKT